jgi:hypothetical protein
MNYYGSKRLDYTKPYKTRRANLVSGIVRPSAIHFCPEEFIRATMEWLDENLSEVIKRGIGFNKASVNNCNEYRTSDAKRRRATLLFLSTRVKFTVCEDLFGPEEWGTEVDYADPRMFDILALAMKRFYNGL